MQKYSATIGIEEAENVHLEFVISNNNYDKGQSQREGWEKEKHICLVQAEASKRPAFND